MIGIPKHRKQVHHLFFYGKIGSEASIIIDTCLSLGNKYALVSYNLPQAILHAECATSDGGGYYREIYTDNISSNRVWIEYIPMPYTCIDDAY
jgi:hypothetical protein